MKVARTVLKERCPVVIRASTLTESRNSYTGFVAEAWFSEYPEVFKRNVEKVIQHFVAVRRIKDGPADYAMSIPVIVPNGQVKLGFPSRGSRVKLQP